MWGVAAVVIIGENPESLANWMAKIEYFVSGTLVVDTVISS